MNIGHSDWESFQIHTEKYNMTFWELSMTFEDTYIVLIKAIRTLGYPERQHGDAVKSPEPAIFVMRPFRGKLEQATRSVVDRLRSEGDRMVFWLDTGGWLNGEVDLDGRAEDQDFFLDGTFPHS
jgi:hypothetical protein